MKLPYNGEFHKSDSPRFGETVVFVHFFGGNKQNCRRHIEFVNTLGFNAASFTMSFNAPIFSPRIPWDSKMTLGFVHVWTEEIEVFLNAIPGKKILFGFSSPSGAMMLAAFRRNFSDVSAMVFDSGPFINNLNMLLPTLLTKSKQVPLHMKLFTVFANQLLFGRKYVEHVQSALQRLPVELPILSIRSWKDDLVPSSNIEEYFALANDINLEVLNLTSATHVAGLKTSPDEYQPRVERFLKESATPF